jgi:CBS domain-containing protein
VMTREVFSCPSDSSISDVCKLMEKKQVRRLVIKDGNDDLCGIVSLADVALQTPDSQSGEVLKKVSQPS